jgi:hypothetical protein
LERDKFLLRRVLIPHASANALYRAAQVVVEGAPRTGILAQARELIPDALGLRIRRV